MLKLLQVWFFCPICSALLLCSALLVPGRWCSCAELMPCREEGLLGSDRAPSVCAALLHSHEGPSLWWRNSWWNRLREPSAQTRHLTCGVLINQSKREDLEKKTVIWEEQVTQLFLICQSKSMHWWALSCGAHRALSCVEFIENFFHFWNLDQKDVTQNEGNGWWVGHSGFQTGSQRCLLWKQLPHSVLAPMPPEMPCLEAHPVLRCFCSAGDAEIGSSSVTPVKNEELPVRGLLDEIAEDEMWASSHALKSRGKAVSIETASLSEYARYVLRTICQQVMCKAALFT